MQGKKVMTSQGKGIVITCDLHKGVLVAIYSREMQTNWFNLDTIEILGK